MKSIVNPPAIHKVFVVQEKTDWGRKGIKIQGPPYLWQQMFAK
jgi:hypothetical protein